MISQNDILTSFYTQLNSVTTLRSILGATGRIVKGPRRPANMSNPCITIQMPTRSYAPGAWGGTNPLIDTTTEPIFVTVFADNHNNGAHDVGTLSTICANVNSIQATARPTIAGATVHRMGQPMESGPIYDPQDPHEAYQVMSLGYWISES